MMSLEDADRIGDRNKEPKNAGVNALHFNLQQTYLFPDSLQNTIASLHVSGNLTNEDLQMISIFFSKTYTPSSHINRRIYMQQPQQLGFMKLISALAKKHPLDRHTGKEFITFLEHSSYHNTFAHIDNKLFEQYRYLSSIFSQQQTTSTLEEASTHIDTYDTYEQTKFLSYLVHRFDSNHIGLIQPQFSTMTQEDKKKSLLPIQEDVGEAFTTITQEVPHIHHTYTHALLNELTYIHLLSKTISLENVTTCIGICIEKGIFAQEHGNIYKAFLKAHQTGLIKEIEQEDRTNHIHTSTILDTPQWKKRLQQFIATAYEIQHDIDTLITDKQHIYISHHNNSSKFKNNYTAINKQLHLPEKAGVLPLFVYIRHACSKTDLHQELGKEDDMLTEKGIQDILELSNNHILAHILHGKSIFSGNRGPTEQSALLYDYIFDLKSTISNHEAWGNTDKHKPDNYGEEQDQDRIQKIDDQMAVQNLDDFFLHLSILHSICFIDGVIPIITHGSKYKYLQRKMHKEPGSPDNLEATMLPRYRSQEKNDTNFFHLENGIQTLIHIQKILDSFGIHDRYIPGTKIDIQLLHDSLIGNIDQLLDGDSDRGKELLHILRETATAPGIKNVQLFNYIEKYRGEIFQKYTLTQVLTGIKKSLLHIWGKYR